MGEDVFMTNLKINLKINCLPINPDFEFTLFSYLFQKEEGTMSELKNAHAKM